MYLEHFLFQGYVRLYVVSALTGSGVDALLYGVAVEVSKPRPVSILMKSPSPIHKSLDDSPIIDLFSEKRVPKPANGTRCC